MDELKDALRQVDASPELKVAIITGNEKSFAGTFYHDTLKGIILTPTPLAGADISEMAPKTFDQCVQENYLSNWAQMFQATRKPVIAAVNGFAVGDHAVLVFLLTFFEKAWRRLRASDDVRYHHCGNKCKVFAARDKVRDHSRGRWDSTSCKSCWKVKSDGNDPHRASPQCSRG